MVCVKRQLARERLLRRTVAVGAVLTVVLLCEALMAGAMLKPVSRDEHNYCAAAVLLGQGRAIYRDFAYPSQLPYHPLLLAAVYRVFDTAHYLLAGRLVSVFCDIAVLLSIVGIYRRIFGGHRLEGLVFGLAAGVFYVFNPLVDYAAGYAWNHDVVIFCVILAFWLFLTVDFQRGPCIWRVAAMGALLTFATCMRVTTALVELLFLVAVLASAGGSVRARLRAALPFSLAGLAVAAWPIWVCAQAPEAVWLNLVRMPVLYGQWLRKIGMVHGKVTMTKFCLTEPGYLVLLAVSGCLLWVAVRRWSNLSVMTRRNLIVASALPLCFSVIAFIPPTMWDQYWAAPVPFLAISLAFPLAGLCRGADRVEGKRTFRMASWAVFIGAVMTVMAHPVVLYRLRDATVPQQWAPIVLHRISTDMAGRAKDPKRVLTLGPLYALEGGSSIYPELSSGSIAYRIADALSENERATSHTVGPTTLKPLVEQAPPAAVVVGVESPQFSFLEESLQSSTGSNWPVETYPKGLRAYFRP